MKTKQIAIPQPCSQPWAEMQPKDQGRFCNNCQKPVIDFTGYDNEAFIAYFQNTKEIPCGRVTTSQLSLSIPLQQTCYLRPAKLYKYVAASLLSIVGIPALTQARQTTAVVTTAGYQTPEPQQATKGTEPGSSAIRGRVVDENGEGLPGASVHIENTETRTITDVDGNFVLSVNAEGRPSGVLEIKWMGYITVKMPLNTFTDKTTIKMEPAEIMLQGEVSIVRRPNLWQRITFPLRRRH